MEFKDIDTVIQGHGFKNLADYQTVVPVSKDLETLLQSGDVPYKKVHKRDGYYIQLEPPRSSLTEYLKQTYLPLIGRERMDNHWYYIYNNELVIRDTIGLTTQYTPYTDIEFDPDRWDEVESIITNTGEALSVPMSIWVPTTTYYKIPEGPNGKYCSLKTQSFVFTLCF